MKIKLLSKDVAEKIAAGEVIERPASVVKELVENSIDAGADRITVEINNMGVDLIKITDNGIGMNKEDLKLSILRYATSKLNDIDDLEKIYTFGFRGEALPSIARVSKLEVITREKNNNLGYKLSVIGGENEKIEEFGASLGTQIIVKDLFYNTPARKKFLKSKITEYAYIYQIMESIVIAFPDISLTLILDGKEKLNLNKSKDKLEHISLLFGKNYKDQLLELNYKNSFVKVSGYISKPDFTEKRKNNQYVFINNRPIISKLIFGAITEGYREYLMKNNYPIVFLFLEMDPSYFDVNVHPRKLEVKFFNEQGLFSLIVSAIRQTILESKNKKYVLPKKEIYETNFNRSNNSEKKAIRENLEILYKKNDTSNFDVETRFIASPSQQINRENNNTKLENKQEESIQYDFDKDIVVTDISALAWLPDKYILAERQNRNLVVIDQHAAHERVLYETLKEKYKTSAIESQGLLIPSMLDIPPHKAEILKSSLAKLEKLGFIIEEFGINSFAIKSVPSIISVGSEKELVIEIVSKLLENENKNVALSEEILDKIIMLSCKYAIKSKDKMSQIEMQKLIKDLFKCKNPYHCPHGRPVLITISEEELDKRFGRE
jgi:DNA mismatch repair protein MutL